MKNTATRLLDSFNQYQAENDSKIYDYIIDQIINGIDDRLDGYIGKSYDVSFILKPEELFENWKSINADEYSKILEIIHINAPTLYDFKNEKSKELTNICFLKIISILGYDGFGVDYDEQAYQTLLNSNHDVKLFKFTLEW